MPLDRGALDAQLREIGEPERWWEHREFRELPHVLHPGERIRALVSGRLPGSRRPALLPAKPWLFVVTDQRLVLLRQERHSRRQIDVLPGRIARIHQRSRTFAFHVTIEAPPARYRLRVDRADAFRFASALAALAPAASAPPAPAALPASTPADGAGAEEPLASAVRRLEREVAELRREVERLRASAGGRDHSHPLSEEAP